MEPGKIARILRTSDGSQTAAVPGFPTFVRAGTMHPVVGQIVILPAFPLQTDHSLKKGLIRYRSADACTLQPNAAQLSTS